MVRFIEELIQIYKSAFYLLHILKFGICFTELNRFSIQRFFCTFSAKSKCCRLRRHFRSATIRTTSNAVSEFQKQKWTSIIMREIRIFSLLLFQLKTEYSFGVNMVLSLKIINILAVQLKIHLDRKCDRTDFGGMSRHTQHQQNICCTLKVFIAHSFYCVYSFSCKA